MSFLVVVMSSFVDISLVIGSEAVFCVCKSRDWLGRSSPKSNQVIKMGLGLVSPYKIVQWT